MKRLWLWFYLAISFTVLVVLLPYILYAKWRGKDISGES